MRQLEFLEQRKFDDEDIQADIEFLKEKMEASLQDLSSYDEYLTEVRSGRLEWSPVHRSEKFWRENAHKLNDANYELLKVHILIYLTIHQEIYYPECRFFNNPYQAIGNNTQNYCNNNNNNGQKTY